MVQLLTLCPLIFSVCQLQHLLACWYSDLLPLRMCVLCLLPREQEPGNDRLKGSPLPERRFSFVCVCLLAWFSFVFTSVLFCFYFQAESHITQAGFRFTMQLRLVLNWSFCLYRSSAELQLSLWGALLMNSLFGAVSPSSAVCTSRSHLLVSKTSNCLVPLHPFLWSLFAVAPDCPSLTKRRGEFAIQSEPSAAPSHCVTPGQETLCSHRKLGPGSLPQRTTVI